MIAALLISRGDSHADALTDVEVHDENIVTYITRQQAADNGFLNITLVRNPYARALSLYKDFGLRRHHKKMVSDPSIDRTKPNELDFFIDRQIAPSQDDRDNGHVRSQTWYIADTSNLLVDRVYRNETIDQLFDDWGLTHVHRNRTPETFDLTQRQKHTIYHRYQRDFEILGYAK